MMARREGEVEEAGEEADEEGAGERLR